MQSIIKYFISLRYFLLPFIQLFCVNGTILLKAIFSVLLAVTCKFPRFWDKYSDIIKLLS